jgi:hypothetical protein
LLPACCCGRRPGPTVLSCLCQPSRHLNDHVDQQNLHSSKAHYIHSFIVWRRAEPEADRLGGAAKSVEVAGLVICEGSPRKGLDNRGEVDSPFGDSGNAAIPGAANKAEVRGNAPRVLGGRLPNASSPDSISLSLTLSHEMVKPVRRGTQNLGMTLRLMLRIQRLPFLSALWTRD